jgi:hypothetical protein
MANSTGILAGLALFLMPFSGAAQEPLSVIDWLSENQPRAGLTLGLSEPPITATATQPTISVVALDESPRLIGLVPPSVTGLPVTLWSGSDPAILTRLIETAPVTQNPALQTLLYTLLLTEARAANDPHETESQLLARIDRLMNLGAVDPAQALIEQIGPTISKPVFARWFDATLLTGNEAQSCAVLRANPQLAPGQAAQVFCTARGGDLAAASVMFDGARALGLFAPQMTAALDRFLHPEYFDGVAPLPAPTAPSPLLFRLYEAIGEALTTSGLPKAFAAADLRDLTGWKSQLEAAERLARTGAMSANNLLGLYTDRLPAASGGIWDRVAALQRFETALNTRSPDAISKTLPAVWSAMRTAHLEVPFADLFADTLSQVPLTNPISRSLAFRVALLSAVYETAAQTPPDTQPDTVFLAALARGEPATATAPSNLHQAISEGFAPAPKLPDDLGADRLGETILRVMILFDRGARGNLQDLTDALNAMRALGLEDSARRAALQLLILDRG